MDTKNPEDKVVSFQQEKDKASQSTDKGSANDSVHEVLSQDPYYKFIHDLLFAIESAGLPLDKDSKEKARELYAKYKRENLIAQWERELEAEREAKKQKDNKPDMVMIDGFKDRSNQPNSDTPE